MRHQRGRSVNTLIPTLVADHVHKIVVCLWVEAPRRRKYSCGRMAAVRRRLRGDCHILVDGHLDVRKLTPSEACVGGKRRATSAREGAMWALGGRFRECDHCDPIGADVTNNRRRRWRSCRPRPDSLLYRPPSFVGAFAISDLRPRSDLHHPWPTTMCPASPRAMAALAAISALTVPPRSADGKTFSGTAGPVCTTPSLLIRRTYNVSFADVGLTPHECPSCGEQFTRTCVRSSCVLWPVHTSISSATFFKDIYTNTIAGSYWRRPLHEHAKHALLPRCGAIGSRRALGAVQRGFGASLNRVLRVSFLGPRTQSPPQILCSASFE